MRPSAIFLVVGSRNIPSPLVYEDWSIPLFLLGMQPGDSRLISINEKETPIEFRVNLISINGNKNS